jgi:hypothetical protein
MRTTLLCGLALIGLPAGCLQTPGSATGRSPIEVPQQITRLVPLADQVHVTTAGHRVAEFMAARDPHDADHLVVAVGDYDSPSGTLNCAFAVSKDGGKTWTVSRPVPGLARAHLQFDGWVSIALDGTVHMICLDTAGSQGQTWPYYSSSKDGGLTWAPAVRIPTATTDQSQDKSSLLVARDGTVYAAYSDEIARTSDLGRTWKKGQSVCGAASRSCQFGLPNGAVEGLGGALHFMFMGGERFFVLTSRDRGQTWTPVDVASAAVAPGYNDQNRWVRQEPWTTEPDLLVSPTTGHLFLASQSWDAAAGLFKVHVHRSIDEGATWQELAAPGFPSDSCRPCHVTHPAAAIDGAGRFGLEVQLANDGGQTKEVWFSASDDEGTSWLPPMPLSKTSGSSSWANVNAFAPPPSSAVRIAQGLAQDPADAQGVVVGVGLTTAVSELQMRWNGEYWGMQASKDGFVCLWIDHTGNGVPQLWSRLVAAQ